MRKDIAGFTADEDHLPAFVSIEDLGDTVIATMRGKRVRNDLKGRDDPGPMAEVIMTHEAWAKVVAAAAAYKRGGSA
jgi:hypothetical protein